MRNLSASVRVSNFSQFLYSMIIPDRSIRSSSIVRLLRGQTLVDFLSLWCSYLAQSCFIQTMHQSEQPVIHLNMDYSIGHRISQYIRGESGIFDQSSCYKDDFYLSAHSMLQVNESTHLWISQDVVCARWHRESGVIVMMAG